MNRWIFCLALLPAWIAVIKLAGAQLLELQPNTPAAGARQASEGAGAPIFSYPTLGSTLLDKQLELYLRYLEVYGPPDILIVGSSRSLQGVDPVILRDGLASNGYADLKIFNFGINGATAQVIDLLLREILTPEQLPRMIVWADGVRAFNSGRADRTYKAIVASPGYQRLSGGIRPALQPPGSRPEPAAPATLVEPAAPATLVEPGPAAPPEPAVPASPEPAVPASPEPGRPIIDPINFRPQVPAAPGNSATGTARFSLVANYQQARDSATSFPIDFSSFSPGPFFRGSLAERIAAGGQPDPKPAAAKIGLSERDVALTGFNPISTRFNPATYYDRFPRVPGEYDGDYASFSLEGEQSVALLSVVDVAKSQNIPLVVVNLPLTKEYLDPLRLQCEREFQDRMQRLAQQEGFIFRDLSGRWLSQNDYFADPSHLNRFGAEAVAKQLAQDRTLPWPTPKR
ncbi:MAG: hypothetical protein KME26_21215 [Oscillatoria princeps RMCB-10]|jgi:hypothetical protein|nr:hypothetical protein [Oscillatoria princeps RMCB-10]